MILTFLYNEEKDIKCLLSKGPGSTNSPDKATKMYETLLSSVSDLNDKEKVLDFIRSNRPKEEDIAKNILKLQENWNHISAEFEKRAETIFGTKLNDTITVYLTITGRFPYSIEERYFFVSALKTNANATCMHELWHFYTWQKFGKTWQEKIGPAKYNEIKEALTVLLNVQCADLMSGEVDRGYQQHQELRAKIVEVWNKERSIETVWHESFASL